MTIESFDQARVVNEKGVLFIDDAPAGTGQIRQLDSGQLIARLDNCLVYVVWVFINHKNEYHVTGVYPNSTGENL